MVRRTLTARRLASAEFTRPRRRAGRVAVTGQADCLLGRLLVRRPSACRRRGTTGAAPLDGGRDGESGRGQTGRDDDGERRETGGGDKHEGEDEGSVAGRRPRASAAGEREHDRCHGERDGLRDEQAVGEQRAADCRGAASGLSEASMPRTGSRSIPATAAAASTAAVTCAARRTGLRTTCPATGRKPIAPIGASSGPSVRNRPVRGSSPGQAEPDHGQERVGESQTEGVVAERQDRHGQREARVLRVR